jgi:hypothetical protein
MNTVFSNLVKFHNVKFHNVVNEPLLLLIIDYIWFIENQEEIDDWCFKQYNYRPRNGLFLSFNNESDVALFLLRWV